MVTFSSIGRRLLPALLLLGSAALTACWDKEKNEDCAPKCDGVPATVRDLTGLDGCGKVLELANGRRLEPSGAEWTNFKSANGQRVIVRYEPNNHLGSICMVGQSVTVTCIQAADAAGSN